MQKQQLIINYLHFRDTVWVQSPGYTSAFHINCLELLGILIASTHKDIEENPDPILVLDRIDKLP